MTNLGCSNVELDEQLSDEQLAMVAGGAEEGLAVFDDVFPNHIFGAGRINAFKSLTSLIN